MSAHPHHDTYAREKVHRVKLHRKADKIQALKALLDMHESLSNPDPDYIRSLRQRLHATQIQYQAMQK